MRRAQKTHKWQRKQTVENRGLWFPVAPVMYGCEPAHVKALAHKHLRILKRLAAGEELRRIGKAWRWLKNSGGKVKDALLRGMQRLGMVKVIGGRWLLTADGLAAVSRLAA